ncbi:LacI family DNA-binding transcriptional regulator [Pseudonocardia ailaonensis]|uniref:LacI family DNA-binding transcriptional regulator n=1 Tax=Pseudonocardia ailaonensis TaxID=367279 RepID=A0ABN2MT45_9PSEU
MDSPHGATDASTTARPDSPRPTTMTDVARRAGVSRATASYVLNSTPGTRIPEPTRVRVFAAAEELRYVPHVNARSLRRGRSDLIIGHVERDAVLRGRIPALGLAQVAADLRRAGFMFLMHGDPTLVGVAAARAWLALRPAAVVAFAERFTEDSVAMLAGAGTVPVAVGTAPSDLTATVVLDDGDLGRAAAEHLLARGCRRIAVVSSGMPGSSLPRVAGADPRGEPLANRVSEALRIARAAGAEAEAQHLVPDPAAAAALVASWRRTGLPDGVVGATDRHAGMVLGALMDAGIRVPDDVAVIGADDDPYCELLRPRLTSTTVDLSSGSARMADAVLAAVEGRWDPRLAVRRFPAHVVERESS